MQAYRQTKLALVMLTFDLADELRYSNVTVSCLHLATFVPTKMVLDAGIAAISSPEQGVRASVRLILDPALDNVTGRYFDGTEEAQTHAQATRWTRAALTPTQCATRRLADPYLKRALKATFHVFDGDGLTGEDAKDVFNIR